MPFIKKIEGLSSLAIVGTAKNTGKTESLNYLLRRLREEHPSKIVGVTSIGIDGERRDQVTQTEKPEITFEENMLFATAEQFYRLKRLPTEVLEIEREFTTSIGKLILSRAKGRGKALIAGPPSTGGLRKVVERMQWWGSDLSIIDGALSRVSLASPSVAEGMILATGASYSAQPDLLIQRTKDLYRLIQLPELEDRGLALKLEEIEQGIRIITPEKEVIDTGVVSALLPDLWKDVSWMESGGAMYVPGVVNDRLLDKLRVTKSFTRLIVKDFTRIFSSGSSVRNFLAAGKELVCLNRTKLVALTFNPQAPSGYRLDSQEMCERLQDAIGIPVYDVRRI
ncbi:hypothetical protein QYZ87_02205 [Porphyromonadaceae bacterium W3.11]|nr:hypothetical protein [Porphyromonadaceae bacterium W3.11]